MSSILKITNLVKHYDQFDLDHINLEVPKGCITGFIGSNGAGKTTTIKSILGLIGYDGGSIELFGTTCSELTNKEKERIGVVFDTLPFPADCRLSDIAAIGKAAPIPRGTQSISKSCSIPLKYTPPNQLSRSRAAWA